MSEALHEGGREGVGEWVNEWWGGREGEREGVNGGEGSLYKYYIIVNQSLDTILLFMQRLFNEQVEEMHALAKEHAPFLIPIFEFCMPSNTCPVELRPFILTLAATSPAYSLLCRPMHLAVQQLWERLLQGESLVT